MRIELLDQWGDAARKLPGKAQGRRYPGRMRARAVQLAAAARAAGVRQAEVCRRLGIPDVTLSKWMRRVDLVPVEVIAEESPVRLSIGIGHAEVSLDQVAQLLGVRR